MFEQTEQKDEELWSQIFKDIDTDGDGQISFTEFCNSMTKVIKSNAPKYFEDGQTLDSEVNNRRP